MSSNERATLLVDVAGTRLTREDEEILRHPRVIGVILFTRNYESPRQLQELVAAIKALRTPSLLVTVDQEGGRVQRFRDGFTRLPAAATLGEVYDRDPRAGLALARETGWLMAAELCALGVDLSFAPVVDLDRGLNTVIGDRAFHADPTAVSRLAAAYAGGMAETGMSACIKHFPGHGGVAEDSHKALPVDTREANAIHDADLIPFRDMVQQGAGAVMMAHVRYAHVDAEPASLSRKWIGEILRKTLRFEGVVFCDDLSMNGVALAGGYAERAAAALRAGCDILPVCNNREGVVACLDAPLPEMSGHIAVEWTGLQARSALNRATLQRSTRWKRARQNMIKLVR